MQTVQTVGFCKFIYFSPRFDVDDAGVFGRYTQYRCYCFPDISNEPTTFLFYNFFTIEEKEVPGNNNVSTE